ncbi:hypothetical protein [Blastococcus saxobsidens]|uniref:Uncharacterized protein n=1 Tax=Blastococcus saxobsidens (strain DD2) TaxID=1146883 RepID=H6RJK4_BLASD|nr:hypothetical protein [Blastococcus saxobsidens]CCG02309.1 protein of unknown function [Blastococcus saxobsidens DD2]
MDAWTALVLSRQTARELQRDAARHRLAKLAAASARTRPSAAISASCGRYGSRLHGAADGTWFGYARRPDAAIRKRCEHGQTEGLPLMAAASEHLEQLPAEIVIDLLDEPRTT